jgi:hypothetical protein
LQQEIEAINAALSRLKPDKSVLGEETTPVKKGKGKPLLSPEELELRKNKKKIAEVIDYLTQMAQVRDISLVPSESLIPVQK